MKLISKGARVIDFGDPFEIPDAGQMFELESDIAAQACINADWATYFQDKRELETYNDAELSRMVMETGNDHYPIMDRSELLEVLNAE